jgi:hypothetical protein
MEYPEMKRYTSLLRAVKGDGLLVKLAELRRTVIWELVMVIDVVALVEVPATATIVAC